VKALVVDLSLSSDEEDLIANVSPDEEFARRLFGELNHDFLGPLGNSKIIILNVSDEEEEEVCEKKVITNEATPSSTARSLTPTASADDTDGTDKGDAPDRVIGGSNSDRDEAGLP
jgi:hypothetical protein